MGMSISGHFVRAATPDDLARIAEYFDARGLDRLDPLELCEGAAFALTRVGDWDGTSDLSEESRALGEVIDFSATSVADMFAYDHYRDGALLRSLQLQAEPNTWVRVAGDPEPWEPWFATGGSGWLEKLHKLRSWLEDDYAGEELAERRAEIDRVLADPVLVEGARYPWATGTDVLAVIDAFQLPPLAYLRDRRAQRRRR